MVAEAKPLPFPYNNPFKVVVTPKVPAPVTGEPDTEKPEGIDKPTEVTEPLPEPSNIHEEPV